MALKKNVRSWELFVMAYALLGAAAVNLWTASTPPYNWTHATALIISMLSLTVSVFTWMTAKVLYRREKKEKS